jgi:hypothetical protein
MSKNEEITQQSQYNMIIEILAEMVKNYLCKQQNTNKEAV